MSRTHRAARSSAGLLLICAGLAISAFDVYMSVARTGFLVPQMALALVAIALIISGALQMRS